MTKRPLIIGFALAALGLAGFLVAIATLGGWGWLVGPVWWVACVVTFYAKWWPGPQ